MKSKTKCVLEVSDSVLLQLAHPRLQRLLLSEHFLESYPQLPQFVLGHGLVLRLVQMAGVPLAHFVLGRAFRQVIHLVVVVGLLVRVQVVQPENIEETTFSLLSPIDGGRTEEKRSHIRLGHRRRGDVLDEHLLGIVRRCRFVGSLGACRTRDVLCFCKTNKRRQTFKTGRLDAKELFGMYVLVTEGGGSGDWTASESGDDSDSLRLIVCMTILLLRVDGLDSPMAMLALREALGSFDDSSGLT